MAEIDTPLEFLDEGPYLVGDEFTIHRLAKEAQELNVALAWEGKDPSVALDDVQNIQAIKLGALTALKNTGGPVEVDFALVDDEIAPPLVLVHSSEWADAQKS